MLGAGWGRPLAGGLRSGIAALVELLHVVGQEVEQRSGLLLAEMVVESCTRLGVLDVDGKSRRRPTRSSERDADKVGGIPRDPRVRAFCHELYADDICRRDRSEQDRLQIASCFQWRRAAHLDGGCCGRMSVCPQSLLRRTSICLSTCRDPLLFGAVRLWGVCLPRRNSRPPGRQQAHEEDCLQQADVLAHSVVGQLELDGERGIGENIRGLQLAAAAALASL